MFISQEYQRRFGDATQPSHSQDDQMVSVYKVIIDIRMKQIMLT